MTTSGSALKKTVGYGSSDRRQQGFFVGYKTGQIKLANKPQLQFWTDQWSSG